MHGTAVAGELHGDREDRAQSRSAQCGQRGVELRSRGGGGRRRAEVQHAAAGDGGEDAAGEEVAAAGRAVAGVHRRRKRLHVCHTHERTVRSSAGAKSESEQVQLRGHADAAQITK